MTWLKRQLKRHWPMLLVVLALGFYNYLPRLAYQNNLGSAFAGITKSFIDDDLYYLARGQEVLDGHALLSSPCFSEHKDGTPMQFWLPDYLLAKPLALLGVNAVAGYNFYSLALPILVALLTYSAIFNLVGSRKMALSGALIFNSLLFFGLFSRLPSPGLNFIFWLTLFNLLIIHLKNHGKCCLALITVNLGLLFYIYPYYWTFGFIMLALMMIGGKIWIADFKIKNYLLMLAGALLIGARYFWELWQGLKSPAYQDALARLGLLNTHFPSGLKIVMLALVLGGLLLWLLRKKIIPMSPLFVLLFSGTVAALLTVNQHLVTGKNLEFSSHYWMPGAFVFVLAGFYCFQYLMYKFISLSDRQNIRILLLGVVLAWSFVSMSEHASAVSALEPMDVYRQNYAPVFNWLKQNTPKDSVIYANQDLSVFLPIYTGNNVYYHQACTLFFITDAEVQTRFAVSKYFDDLSEADIVKYERSVWGTRYLNQYAHNQSKNKLRKIFGLNVVDYVRIPLAEIARLSALLQEIKQLDFRTALKSYQADYLLWDKKSDPQWRADRFNFLTEVYAAGNFIIYKIN